MLVRAAYIVGCFIHTTIITQYLTVTIYIDQWCAYVPNENVYDIL